MVTVMFPLHAFARSPCFYYWRQGV